MIIGEPYYPSNLKNIINAAGEIYDDILLRHISIDSRSHVLGPETVFVAIKGKNFDGHSFIGDVISKGVKTIIVSEPIKLPGVNVLKVEDTTLALQNFAKFHRNKFSFPIIAIAGSRGKTTVKEWLYQLLKDKYDIVRNPKSYNSQIGVPLSLLQITNENNLGIFETGVSEIGEMHKLEQMIKPQIGVLTNVFESENGGLKTIEQKLKEKLKLFDSVENVVVGNEVFKQNQPLDINSVHIENAIQLSIDDQYSKLNANTCIGVLKALKLDPSDFEMGFKHLSSLALRMQKLEGKFDNIVIKDNYSLEVSSFISAIDFMRTLSSSSRILILSLKQDYQSDRLEKYISESFQNDYFKEIHIIGGNLEVEKGVNYYYNALEFMDYYDQKNISNSIILLKGNNEIKRLMNTISLERHETYVDINLNNLLYNYQFFKSKLNSSTKMMVMVKANGYGSGSLEIAKLLSHQHVDYFAVAYANEGVELRRGGIKEPIMVLNPNEDSFAQMIEYQLEPEIYSEKLLDEFIDELVYQGIKEYPIHLKVDTGMHRLGFDVKDLKNVISTIKSQPEVIIKSIFSHLAASDMPEEREFTLNQINSFNKAVSFVKNALPYKIDAHILNSNGIINYPDYQMDMVRLGIGLYGVGDRSLKNVISFKSSVSQIREIEKGESVGYSRKEIANKKMRIATIPVGYADGLKRLAGNRNYKLLVNGIEAPIVGNVCMDMCMLDITDLHVSEGDEVEIFGESKPINILAEIMQTIPYEVLTSISKRVKRVYSKE